MNPDQDNAPSLHVPPQPDPAATANMGDFSQSGIAPPANAPEIPAVPPPASASWLPPTVPVHPGAPSDSNDSGQAAQTIVAAPDAADDGDVIEKEWVSRAKQIVEKTRHDPYNQTKELHKFKAEYMQKRYNKTIKAVEE